MNKLTAVTLITVPTHKNPRLEEMLRAIDGMIRPEDLKVLSWVIVGETDLEEHQHVTSVEAPPEGAYNAGLLQALDIFPVEGHYVLFVDDSTILTKSTLNVIEKAYSKNCGLRVPVTSERNVRIPADGAVAQGEGGGLELVPVTASAVSPSCFGAPLKAFIDIGGFDDAYNDAFAKKRSDAAVRIERAGYAWLTSKRSIAIHMTAGHDRDEELERRRAEKAMAKKNQDVWNALIRDRDRTEPLREPEVKAIEGWTMKFPVEGTKPGDGDLGLIKENQEVFDALVRDADGKPVETTEAVSTGTETGTYVTVGKDGAVTEAKTETATMSASTSKLDQPEGSQAELDESERSELP